MIRGNARKFGLFATLGISLPVIGALAAVLLIPAVQREVRARLGRVTVEQRLAEVEARVAPLWETRVSDAMGASASPALAHIDSLTLLVLKQERELHVFASTGTTQRSIAMFPILAASGTLGPKLREGDLQVPEGFYPITFLNPNSRFRLSMRVGYPSEEDKLAAATERREIANLGGDIMIHGNAVSIGCVAIGDVAIEELFWLVAHVGIDKTCVMLSPSRRPLEHVSDITPGWVRERYEAMERELRGRGM